MAGIRLLKLYDDLQYVKQEYEHCLHSRELYAAGCRDWSRMRDRFEVLIAEYPYRVNFYHKRMAECSVEEWRALWEAVSKA